MNGLPLAPRALAHLGKEGSRPLGLQDRCLFRGDIWSFVEEGQDPGRGTRELLKIGRAHV